MLSSICYSGSTVRITFFYFCSATPSSPYYLLRNCSWWMLEHPLSPGSLTTWQASYTLLVFRVLSGLYRSSSTVPYSFLFFLLLSSTDFLYNLESDDLQKCSGNCSCWLCKWFSRGVQGTGGWTGPAVAECEQDKQDRDRLYRETKSIAAPDHHEKATVTDVYVNIRLNWKTNGRAVN